MHHILTRQHADQVTIWCVLLCYKILSPESVYINRGNHEDWPSNMEQGPYGKGSFHAEISSKYPKRKVSLRASEESLMRVPLVQNSFW